MGASHRQPDSETFRKEAKKEKDEKKILMKEKGKRKKEKGKRKNLQYHTKERDEVDY